MKTFISIIFAFLSFSAFASVLTCKEKALNDSVYIYTIEFNENKDVKQVTLTENDFPIYQANNLTMQVTSNAPMQGVSYHLIMEFENDTTELILNDSRFLRSSFGLFSSEEIISYFGGHRGIKCIMK